MATEDSCCYQAAREGGEPLPLPSDGGEGLCQPKKRVWVPQTTFPSTSEKECKYMGFLLFQMNVGVQGWRDGSADETLCCQA